MSSKLTKPTQEEVDSLAAFIEAAEELQQEPFFGPDMANEQVLALIPCHSLQNADFDSAIYVGKRIITQPGAIDFF